MKIINNEISVSFLGDCYWITKMYNRQMTKSEDKIVRKNLKFKIKK